MMFYPHKNNVLFQSSQDPVFQLQYYLPFESLLPNYAVTVLSMAYSITKILFLEEKYNYSEPALKFLIVFYN